MDTTNVLRLKITVLSLGWIGVLACLLMQVPLAEWVWTLLLAASVHEATLYVALRERKPQE